MNIKNAVSNLFETYHNELIAQEINTEHYLGSNIADNLRGYLLAPGVIVKGSYGVGKMPYIGFVTKIGIGLLIKNRRNDQVHFDADLMLYNNPEVSRILGGECNLTTADQLYHLISLFNNNNI